MTTYYVDLENGNDANDGLSFANRKKTLTSPAATSGDTVRVMASLDPTSLGQTATWRSHRYSRASQMTGTTGITSITGGSGTIVTVTVPTSKLGITGLELADNDWIQIAGVTGMTTVNGIWKISSVNTGAGTFTLVNSASKVTSATATISSASIAKITNSVVTLTSAPYAEINDLSNNRTAWTASANASTVVQSQLATPGTLYHSQVDQISVLAAFTTGKAAYKTLGAALNLSSYSQVSFSIAQTFGSAITAGQMTLNLCSDTLGATVVNAIPIPALSTTANIWNTFTVNYGSALGSNINSISLTVNTDFGAQTIQIGQIIACKAPSASDCITFNSLISPSNDNDPWFMIAGVQGNDVIIRKRDIVSGTTTASHGVDRGGFHGTAGSFTTYVRQPIVINNTGGTTTGWANLSTSGYNGIIYDFGYDRTSMSTQSGYTLIEFGNGYAYGIYLGDGQTFNRVGFYNVGTSGAFFRSAADAVLTQDVTINAHSIGYGNYFIFAASAVGNGHGNLVVTVKSVHSMGISAIYWYSNYAQVTLSADIVSGLASGLFQYNNAATYAGGSYKLTFLSLGRYEGNFGNIVSSGAPYFEFNNTTFRYNGSGIMAITNKMKFNNCTFVGNWGIISGLSTGKIYFNSCTFNSDNYWDLPNISSSRLGVSGQLYLKNCECNAPVFDSVTSVPVSYGLYRNECGIYFTNCTGTGLANGQWREGCIVEAQTAVRHTASGYAWKISPQNTTIVNSNDPFMLSLGKVACSANNLVTVKAWMRRSNTGLTMALVCPGGQISGVTTDQSSSMTASADTWEELTITFTPTETGIVEIYAKAYGGSTYSGYVDDVTITQA